MKSLELENHFVDATLNMNVDNTTQCVDGRTLKSDNTNGISVPGASIGQLAVILGVFEEVLGSKMSTSLREELLGEFIKAIGGVEKFNYHIDQHAVNHNKKEKDDFRHGCGHIGLLVSEKNRKDYGLPDESVNFIEQKVAEFKNSKNIVNLQGDHEEQGVAIISSQNYTVSANHNGKQFFVYTQGASHKFFEKLAGGFKAKYPHLHIDGETLAETLNKHMDQSAARTVLMLTGNKELPIHLIDHDINGKMERIQNITLAELYQTLGMNI